MWDIEIASLVDEYCTIPLQGRNNVLVSLTVTDEGLGSLSRVIGESMDNFGSIMATQRHPLATTIEVARRAYLLPGCGKDHRISY